MFGERPAELTLDIQPDPEYIKNYTERALCQVEIQSVPDKSEHEV
jgi:dynein intermediate chain 2, axonemal